MEHWESLKSGGYRFVYDDALFRPGTDTFVLSSFPRLKPGLRVWDLGCGTGLLGLLLLQRQQALQVTGLELQAPAAELAQRAAIQNGLDGRFRILQGDLRKIRSLSPSGGADLVLCNPPYYSPLCGKLPAGEALRAAGRRPTAPWKMSARRQPICCAGAGASAWSISRSGWPTCWKLCGRRRWSQSGCVSSAPVRRTPPLWCWREGRRGGGRVLP